MKIALYTHSTNPRGGVVHTLALGDALAHAGHEVSIFAPDVTGAGFFRNTAARHVSIKAAPAAADLPAMVAQRIAEIAAHVRADRRGYDIHHAQDSINANALADCVASGDIRGFIRTVHHVDDYADTRLAAWQRRGIQAADRCFCVSGLWRDFLRREHRVNADLVPNGVALEKFSATPAPHDAVLRARWQLGSGPVFLSVGGIEQRKNTTNILRGFELCLAAHPGARLVIAGGASLLDHGAYQAAFHAALAAAGIAARVAVTGPVSDADMQSLYRIADALVFASVKEGFGLVVLEALAAQTPVVVSRIAPFTEYLSDGDCSFCDPGGPASIAAAMRRALTPDAQAEALRARETIAKRMRWQVCAARHLELYQMEVCNA